MSKFDTKEVHSFDHSFFQDFCKSTESTQGKGINSVVYFKMLLYTCGYIKQV